MEKIEVGEVFTITGDDNEENEVEVLAVITLQEHDYVAVGFVDDLLEESDEEIDVFFLKVDEDGDFAPIESDEEFENVSEAFEEIMEADEE